MEQVDARASEGLLVVCPTYDERENVASFARDVLGWAPRANILFVDDHSPDGTADVVRALGRVDPRISLLARGGKWGLGTAYVDGFRWARERGFRRVAQMDSDGSHAGRDLARLLRVSETTGAELVLGSRNVPGGGVLGWGVGRHVLSKGGSLYARTVLGCPVADLTSGFKLFTREALLALEPDTLRSNGYSFQVETTFRAIERGLNVVEVPIVFLDRRVGRSKMSRRIFAEAVIEVVRLRLGKDAGSGGARRR